MTRKPKCAMARRCGFRIVDISFGMFEYELRVIVGHGKNVNKYIRWKFGDSEYNFHVTNQRGMCFHRKGYAPVVWIPRVPKTSKDHGSLAHEMLHAIRFMFQDWTNIPLTYDTDEVYCHALGHAVAAALDGLRS